MKLMICPQCREVIPEGEYSGHGKFCEACFSRQITQNRSDLIELDTENLPSQAVSGGNSENTTAGRDVMNSSSPEAVSGAKNAMQGSMQTSNPGAQNAMQGGSPASSGGASARNAMQGFMQNSNPSYQNTPAYQNTPEPSGGISGIRNIMNSFAQNFASSENKPAPGRRSLPIEQVLLVNGSEWDQESFSGRRTLVLRSRAPFVMLMVGYMFMLVGGGIMSAMLYKVATGTESSIQVCSGKNSHNCHPGTTKDALVAAGFTSIFFFVGLGVTIAGTRMKMSRTWIDIDSRNMTVERGLTRKGKTKVYPRTPETSVTMECTMRVNREPVYTVYMDNSYVGRSTMVSGLFTNDARCMVTMLEEIRDSVVV